MNNLTYTFRESNVRVEMVNNEPWFAAKDVCDILELSNPTVSVGRLDSDEVTKLNLGGLSGETNFVNEYGLYNLIFGSRKPEAKDFKRWVTHEVLPSIRKTGSYTQELSSTELSKMLTIQMQNELSEVQKDVSEIKDTLNKRMTIDYWQQSILLNTKNKRVEHLNENTTVPLERSQLHRQAWSHYKKAFRVASYRDTLSSEFEEAVSWLENWRPLL